MQHRQILQFIAPLIVAANLVLPSSTIAAGLGWYYESFSWQALKSYFGGGTPTQKRLFIRHMQGLIDTEQKEPFYNIDFSKRNLELWKSFIDDGIHYEHLKRTDAQFADEVISIVMGPEAELSMLEVRSETNPDYVHSGAFQHLLKRASNTGLELLLAFEFGRSYGQTARRQTCLGRGSAWRCLDAYVILSPDECATLSLELKRILTLPDFQQSEFEDRKFVMPLANALERVAKQHRGMYIHALD